jgi:hypothetical protein
LGNFKKRLNHAFFASPHSATSTRPLALHRWRSE